MLKIWGYRDSPNVQKVLWCCEELELNYERIDSGGPFGGTRDAAFLARNPNGRVPTIDDEGFVLWESHSILRYLAHKDPAQRLLPTGLRVRARIDQWIDWQSAHLSHALRGLVMMLIRPRPIPPTEHEIAAARAAVEPLFELLNQQLEARPYIAGDTFTLADIPIGVATYRWRTLPLEPIVLPALDAWFTRLAERPARERLFARSAG